MEPSYEMKEAAVGARGVTSPLASERILGLATRALEGAPALTAGEMRELASAVLAHHSESSCAHNSASVRWDPSEA